MFRSAISRLLTTLHLIPPLSPDGHSANGPQFDFHPFRGRRRSEPRNWDGLAQMPTHTNRTFQIGTEKTIHIDLRKITDCIGSLTIDAIMPRSKRVPYLT